jgi:phospholipase/lecithinase/hemolysin
MNALERLMRARGDQRKSKPYHYAKVPSGVVKFHRTWAEAPHEVRAKSTGRFWCARRSFGAVTKTPRIVRRLLAFACVASAFGAFVSAAEPASPWKLLFAFGDSYTDSGAGYVDGDGPTAIVYVARELGIPFTYATDSDAAGKGLNFAVSGAQTGEGEGHKVKDALLGRGMQNQVRDFVAHVQSGAVKFESATTLFFIAGGLNDRRLPTETTLDNLTKIVRQLHAVGARHFLIGLLPQKIPQFAAVGQRLSPAIATLPEKLKVEFADSDIRLSHWGEFMDAVITEPARFGITNTKDACAGRAIFDQDATPRGDPKTYFFYHEGHPSTAVQRFVADELKTEVLAAAAKPMAK